MTVITTYVSPNTMLIPSVNVTNQLTDAVKGLEGAIVRRPLGGLYALADTYASLNIATQTLVEGQSGGSVSATANFIIQSISHTAQERSQTVHTFSEDRVFFYGHAVDTIQVDALLVENETFQWLQEWYTNYKAQLSGTAALAQGKNQKVTLSCEDRKYSGFITDMSMVRTSQDRHGVQVRFTMLVAETGFTREILKQATLLSQQGGDADSFNTINARIKGVVNSNDDVRRATPKELLTDLATSTSYSEIKKSLQNAFPEEFMRDRVAEKKSQAGTSEAKQTSLFLATISFDDRLQELVQAQEKAQKTLAAARDQFQKSYTSTAYVSTSTPTALQRLAYGIAETAIITIQAVAEVGLRSAGLSRGGEMDGYIPIRDDAKILKSAAAGIAKDFGPIETPSNP